MQLKDCRVGDVVKVPVNASNVFAWDRDGELLKKGSFLRATILHQEGRNTAIGWSSLEMEKEPTRFEIRSRPEFSEKFPELKYGVKIDSEVRCEQFEALEVKTAKSLRDFKVGSWVKIPFQEEMNCFTMDPNWLSPERGKVVQLLEFNSKYNCVIGWKKPIKGYDECIISKETRKRFPKLIYEQGINAYIPAFAAELPITKVSSALPFLLTLTAVGAGLSNVASHKRTSKILKEISDVNPRS